MEIYWLGHGAFRLRGRETTVLTDPCPPTTGYRIGKVNTDVVTISSNMAESNYRQAVPAEAIVLSSPGEYEIGGVLINGVFTDHGRDGDNRNVAYLIDVDDVRVCHLGSLSELPSGDEAETLGVADILIVPVGGGKELDAEKAAEVVSMLDPKIVIPMKYKTEASTGDLATIEAFLREMGVQAKPAEQRLNITKSTLPHDRSVVLLNYRGA